MNYIKKLEAEKKELSQTITDVNEALNDLLIYLNSSKFAGFENNYINAQEAFRSVKNIQDIITLNL